MRWTDDLERYGGRDRHRRCVVQRPRLRRPWLGLVPKQISTGDRTILGKISKRGNRYLRVLFVQAAWVVLIKPQSWERHGLKPWIEAAKKRLHRNVLAIALVSWLNGRFRNVRSGWPQHARVFFVRKTGRLHPVTPPRPSRYRAMWNDRLRDTFRGGAGGA
jgi:hypothetical protein